MQKKDASYLLNERIQLKEFELAVERDLLKDEFREFTESLKPINLIKDAIQSPEVKTKVVDTAIGMTSGYIVRKALVRSSKNPFLKLLGTIVGMGVANLVTKHPEGIKSIGGKILSGVFKKENRNVENAESE
jgi:hypothetical protein